MRIAGHDLRNPLCLILMAGDLAKRQPIVAQSPELQGHLQNIADSAGEMRRIIDTFLEIRGPGAGGERLGAMGRVDLNLLAGAVVRQHTLVAERKQIEFATELADALPLARCEAGLAFQACTNLASNALKFTPSGGRVVLATRVRADRVRVEVRDSGPGVPEPERSQLFQEHARLSPRPTAGEESNGLGLSIVKHLVEAQGGTVGAEFPEAGGSVFWFEVPAR